MSHAKDRVLRSTTIGEEKENPPKDPRHNAGQFFTPQPEAFATKIDHISDGFALFGSSIVAPSRHYSAFDKLLPLESRLIWTVVTYWISKGYTFTDDWKLEEPIDKVNV